MVSDKEKVKSYPAGIIFILTTPLDIVEPSESLHPTPRTVNLFLDRTRARFQAWNADNSLSQCRQAGFFAATVAKPPPGSVAADAGLDADGRQRQGGVEKVFRPEAAVADSGGHRWRVRPDLPPNLRTGPTGGYNFLAGFPFIPRRNCRRTRISRKY